MTNDAKVEAVAQALHAEFVARQTRPEDWPTWGELLAQGHQGRNRVDDTRSAARAAISSMTIAENAEMRRLTAENKSLREKIDTLEDDAFDASMENLARDERTEF